MTCLYQNRVNQSLLIVDLIAAREDKKYAAVGHMAAAIIRVTQEIGSCLSQDLIVRGFASHEVAVHWHMAKSIADVELRLIMSTLGASPCRGCR